MAIGHARHEPTVHVVVVVQRYSELLQFVVAFRTIRRLASRLNGRQQQGHQDPNDGNDHQQFNKGETGSFSVHL
jgi:hypothetical protein